MDIQPGKSRIVLKTDTGKKIIAHYLIIAAGYESQQYIPYPVVDLLTTYAIISEPIACSEAWYKNALIWETKTPYLYMRTTSDSRIIVGGRDDEMQDSRKRKKRLPRKAMKLAEDFHQLMPHLFFILILLGQVHSVLQQIRFLISVLSGKCPVLFLLWVLGETELHSVYWLQIYYVLS